MKKVFEDPIVTVVCIEKQDILTTSGENPIPEEETGW